MYRTVSLKRWLSGLPLRDRRRAERHVLPGLVSYYWDGGPPSPRNVREISCTGLFLLTDQRWYPGTLVTMTLQRSASSEGESNHSIVVQTKVVRTDPQGVGLEFSFPPKNSRRTTSAAFFTADKKTLHSFLRQDHSRPMYNYHG
jgi:hypothetical protein